MAQNQNIEDLINSSFNHGIRGVKNKASDWMIRNTVRKVKSHFGLDMEFIYPSLCEVATNWIRKHDKKFEEHLANPYNYEDIGYTPILTGEFFLVLDSHTMAYVSADYKHVTANNGNPNDSQRIYIYIFGKHMMKFFSELRKEVLNARNDSYMIYTITGQSGSDNKKWFQCIGEPLKPRPMDTLYFEPGVKDAVIRHIDSWLHNADIYKSRGLNFKTGILVYGVAGTGKSSLATAIATYLKCSVVVIDTSSFSYIDTNEVTKSINSDDEMYVVLLDEIDAIFKSREDADISEREKTDVVKLLSFLDSPMSPNNVIFVATTNYYDRLDPAVKRKGRFDLEVELDNISYDTAVEMCHGFNLSDAKTKAVMEHHKKTDKINPAALQAQILSALSNKEIKDDPVVEGESTDEEVDEQEYFVTDDMELDDEIENIDEEDYCEESGESDGPRVTDSWPGLRGDFFETAVPTDEGTYPKIEFDSESDTFNAEYQIWYDSLSDDIRENWDRVVELLNSDISEDEANEALTNFWSSWSASLKNSSETVSPEESDEEDTEEASASESATYTTASTICAIPIVAEDDAYCRTAIRDPWIEMGSISSHLEALENRTESTVGKLRKQQNALNWKRSRR